jgi:transcriptional regulator with XRE-family HTH domain
VQNNRIQRLQQLKESQGIGYERLAQEIGVSFMSVYRWLKKGVVPKNRLVLKAIDEFLTRNGYPLEHKDLGRVRPRRGLSKQ